MSFDWLLRPAGDDISKPFAIEGALPLDDAYWTGWAGHERLRDGVDLYSLDAVVHRTVTLHCTDEMPLASLSGNLCLDGVGGVQPFVDNHDTTLHAGDQTLFLPPAREALFTFGKQPATRNRYLSFSIEAGALAGMLGEEAIPAPMRAMLDEDRPTPFRFSGPANPESRAIARRIVQNPYHGPMARLYVEGQFLSLLAVLCDDLEGGAAPPDPDRVERERIFEARDRLVADLRNPPSLAELARQTGLSEKRLTRGFRRVFGETPFAHLRSVRLDTARRLLAEADVPLKVLAWRLGYDHVSNFVAAYRSRFGQPPRRHAAAGPKETR